MLSMKIYGGVISNFPSSWQGQCRLDNAGRYWLHIHANLSMFIIIIIIKLIAHRSLGLKKRAC